MENKEDTGAKKETGLFWKRCPICVRERQRVGEGYPVSEFNSLLAWVRHMIDHEEAPRRYALHREKWASEELGIPYEPPTGREPKISSQAIRYLPLIADWLQKALDSLPALNEIADSSILTANQLVQLVKKLSKEFYEQRDYMLRYENLLRDTGQDNKWPRTLGMQSKFVAESLAGSEWEVTPSTSREYVRKAGLRQEGKMTRRFQANKPEKEKEAKWWEPESGPEEAG